MATLRHQGHGRASVPAPVVQFDHAGEEPIHPIVRALDLLDRPLRYTAGEDLALLRILRGTAASALVAAIAAVIAGLF